MWLRIRGALAAPNLAQPFTPSLPRQPAVFPVAMLSGSARGRRGKGHAARITHALSPSQSPSPFIRQDTPEPWRSFVPKFCWKYDKPEPKVPRRQSSTPSRSGRTLAPPLGSALSLVGRAHRTGALLQYPPAAARCSEPLPSPFPAPHAAHSTAPTSTQGRGEDEQPYPDDAKCLCPCGCTYGATLTLQQPPTQHTTPTFPCNLPCRTRPSRGEPLRPPSAATRGRRLNPVTSTRTLRRQSLCQRTTGAVRRVSARYPRLTFRARVPHPLLCSPPQTLAAFAAPPFANMRWPPRPVREHSEILPLPICPCATPARPAGARELLGAQLISWVPSDALGSPSCKRDSSAGSRACQDVPDPVKPCVKCFMTPPEKQPRDWKRDIPEFPCVSPLSDPPTYAPPSPHWPAHRPPAQGADQGRQNGQVDDGLNQPARGHDRHGGQCS